MNTFGAIILGPATIRNGLDENNHIISSHRYGFKGSVISMSLGGPYSQTENNLVNTIVSRGVSIVTSSGNNAKDACHYSPGSAGSNINVGGHWYTSNCQKPMYTQSNYGRCVHIVAPGVNVLSANYRSTNSKCSS